MAVHIDPDIQVRPITVAEFDHMIASGVFGEDDRIELLNGVLVMMSPQSPEHAAVVRALNRILLPAAVAAGFDVAPQTPLLVEHDISRPEPDLAIVPRPAPGTHARHAVLVVEASVSSLRVDLGAKAIRYAAAGVGDYWVVDVAARDVVVHREPAAECYRLIRRLGESESLEPLAFPLRVDVGDLLTDVPRG